MRTLHTASRLVLGLAVLAAACGDGNTSGTTAPVPEPEAVTTTIAVGETTVPVEPPATQSPTTQAPTTEPPSTEPPEPEPAPAWPSERAYHDIAYDVESDLVVLVGGCEFGCREAWAFQPADGTWLQLGSLPGALQIPDVNAPTAYDAESDRIIVFRAPVDFADTAGTWAYDADSDNWTEMTPDPHPRLGVGARLVYDTGSDRVVAFGGQGTPGTWAYDFNTNSWELLAPAIEPPGINYHAMAYDAESDCVVVFGITDDLDTLLWAYDYDSNTWEELPLVGPVTHGWVYGRAAYSPETDRTVLFGGRRLEPEDAFHNETWLYDYNTNTWEPGTANDLSGPLAHHAMVYAGATHAVLVFGGERTEDQIPTNGLWAYTPTADVWAEVGPASSD